MPRAISQACGLDRALLPSSGSGSGTGTGTGRPPFFDIKGFSGLPCIVGEMTAITPAIFQYQDLRCSSWEGQTTIEMQADIKAVPDP